MAPIEPKYTKYIKHSRAISSDHAKPLLNRYLHTTFIKTRLIMTAKKKAINTSTALNRVSKNAFTKNLLDCITKKEIRTRPEILNLEDPGP
jgi:hypothetical protein